MREHELLTEKDFNEKESQEEGNTTYFYVVECGLSICKNCGRAESELEEPCDYEL